MAEIANRFEWQSQHGEMVPTWGRLGGLEALEVWKSVLACLDPQDLLQFNPV
jgi:hypothetical protein